MTSLLGINTYSYIWKKSAVETVEHLADQGYSCVELMMNAPHLWPSDTAQRKALATTLARRDVEVMSLNPPMLDLNLVSPAPEMRAYTVQHYCDVIAMAGELGARFVLVVPGKTHPLLPAPSVHRDGWFEAGLETLDRAAEAAGVRLVIENVPAAFAPRAEDLMAILARIGNPRLGIIYDVANAVFFGEDPCEGLRTVASRLDLVHMSDTGRKAWAHATLGTGIVPFDAIAETLNALVYEGPTVLEIISDTPDADIAASRAALESTGWRLAA